MKHNATLLKKNFNLSNSSMNTFQCNEEILLSIRARLTGKEINTQSLHAKFTGVNFLFFEVNDRPLQPDMILIDTAIY